MTVDERLEQLKRKTQRLEKRNRGLKVALTMMVIVAITIQLSACGDDHAEPLTSGIMKEDYKSYPLALQSLAPNLMVVDIVPV